MTERKGDMKDAFWRILKIGEPIDIGATSMVYEHRSKDGVVRVLVDHGMGLQRLPDGDDVEHYPAAFNRPIDVIIVTHAHLDHAGIIPRLVREHPEAYILISEKTLRLAQILWRDALKISWKRRLDALDAGEEPEEPMFLRRDVRRLLDHPKLVVTSDEGERVFALEGLDEDWVFTLYPSGHASGAQCYRIDPPVGRPIFGTGDIALHDQDTVSGFIPPDADDSLGDLLDGNPIMVQECTNGDRDPDRSRAEEDTRFIERTIAVRDRGGVVFCPAFTYARSANLVLKLVKAGIGPIYLDGLARKFFLVEVDDADWLLKSGKVEFMPYPSEEDAQWHQRNPAEKTRLWEEARKFRREVARGDHGFAVIVAGGAVLDQGWAAYYAPHVFRNEESACFLTGHVFENTLAESVRDASPGDVMVVPQLNAPVAHAPLNCRVDQFDFTSHIYRSDIVRLVAMVRPAHLVLHHGEIGAFHSVAEGVATLDSPPAVHMPGHLEQIEIR